MTDTVGFEMKVDGKHSKLILNLYLFSTKLFNVNRYIEKFRDAKKPR